MRLYYTPLLLLVSSLQAIAAYPVQSKVEDEGLSTSPEYSDTPEWRFFRAMSSWYTKSHRQGNPDSIAEKVTIPPPSVETKTNPCSNQSQRYHPVDHHETKNRNCHESSARQYDAPLRSTATQGLFYSSHDVERILVPVGLLVAMIWLAVLAIGLVAVVDYVWVQWARDYSGYSSHDHTDAKLEEGEEGDGPESDITQKKSEADEKY